MLTPPTQVFSTFIFKLSDGLISKPNRELKLTFMLASFSVQLKHP